MTSVIERMRSLLPIAKAPPPVAQKVVAFDSLVDNWLWQGLTTDKNIPDSRRGYALAYLLVPDVRVCVDIYAQNIGRMLWIIKQNSTYDAKNDEIIARSDDIKSRHPFYLATRFHRRQSKMPYMMRLAYSYILFDEMYVHVNQNKFQHGSGMQVLNPLAMQPDVQSGKLLGFRYSGGGQSELIPVNKLAYDHGYNPLSDLRGASLVMTTIDNINPLRNLVRYLNEFFINNARPGASASFKNIGDASDENIVKLKTAIQDYLKGVGKQFNTFISPIPMDWQMFENPDLKKQFAIDDPLTKKIYRGFGVAMSLAGDTSGTSYKDGKDNVASFIKIQAKPHMLNIQDFQTDSVLPLYVEADDDGEIDQRFEFDTSQFDVLTDEDKLQSEVVGTDLSSNVINLAQAQEQRGQDPDPDFEDRYMVEGLPVPKEVFLTLYKTRFTIPADEDSEQAQDDEEPSAADMPDVEVEAPSEKHHAHGVKAFVPVQATSEAELAAWRKVTLKNWQRGLLFDMHWLRGDSADMLLEAIKTCKGSHAAIDAVFKQVSAQVAIKAIQATRLDFEGDFEELLRRARDGSMQRVQWASAVRTMMRHNGRKAFVDGLEDGGISEPELSEEDTITINSLLQEQSQFVTALGKLLFKEDGVSDPQAVQKPAMWFNKAIMPLYQAGLASADKNGLYEWAVGNTEHCDTCLRLDGQRHRMRDYMRKGLMPQSDLLDCKGYNCECRLVRVFGKVRGTF